MKNLLIILLLLATSIAAQDNAETADSVTTKEGKKIILHQNLSLHNLNTIDIRESFFTDFSAYPELERIAAEMSMQPEPDMRNLQANLLANFKQSMKWKADYSLGVFGEVLGTAMTAAAIGLGAYSVAKYGKDYFGSKKRRK